MQMEQADSTLSDNLLGHKRFNVRPDSRGELTLSFRSLDPETLSLDQRSIISSGFDTNRNRAIKTCLLSVVYDCINEFQILSNVFNSVVKCCKVTSVPYENLDQRFGNFDSYDERQLAMNYNNIHKLQESIALILYLLNRLVDEVKKYGTITLVREYTENLTRMKQDEENLMKKLKAKLNELDRLRRACVNERENKITLVNSCNNILKDSLRTINDEIEAATVGVKYLKKWQDARYEQNSLKLKQAEERFSKKNEHMRLHIELEERCHDEFTSYIEEAQQDSMDEIQGWMEHYEGALEAKETEIFNLRMDMEKLKDKFETVKSTYEERRVQIEQFLEYKRKKKEEEDLLALQIWAATKIQAWWRGMMLRYKLGPYRKKKGKEKGKDKGKNKREKPVRPKKRSV